MTVSLQPLAWIKLNVIPEIARSEAESAYPGSYEKLFCEATYKE